MKTVIGKMKCTRCENIIEVTIDDVNDTLTFEPVGKEIRVDDEDGEYEGICSNCDQLAQIVGEKYRIAGSNVKK